MKRSLLPEEEIDQQKEKPMRNIIFLIHLSLDGFAAGPNDELDWIGLRMITNWNRMLMPCTTERTP
jgi:hypothetical protein